MNEEAKEITQERTRETRESARERRKRGKRKRMIRQIVSGVGFFLCLIFGFMLICNLTLIIKGTVSPEKPPSVLGVTPMVVLSGSMSGDAEDHIEVGDLIFVGKADAQQLQAGDIIAFMEGDTVITHRIVEVQTDDAGQPQFVTKGDANNAADDKPVTVDHLVGIYKSRIPKVGDFALFLQTPMGMILFIGVPLLAFIIYDIVRRHLYAKRERKRTARMQAELNKLRRQARETADADTEKKDT